MRQQHRPKRQKVPAEHFFSHQGHHSCRTGRAACTLVLESVKDTFKMEHSIEWSSWSKNLKTDEEKYAGAVYIKKVYIEF
jgi:hypothetical protein